MTRVAVAPQKPHALDYSPTLHGPDGERLAGFDNFHPVGRQRSGDLQDHRNRLRTSSPVEEDPVGRRRAAFAAHNAQKIIMY